ncbi:MAG: ferredoxin--NADP reductase [Pseudomonadales bacterium]|nr:ferredoxin--NADP reductase [Pseudomonadales bacterium]
MSLWRRIKRLIVDLSEVRVPQSGVRIFKLEKNEVFSTDAYRMNVVAIQYETADAITMVLQHPEGKPMHFLPGMFMTLLLSIDGIEYRRAYSICTSAQESTNLGITIKRVPGGVVSNWVHDHIKEGDVLRVRGPSGNFTLAPQRQAPLHRLMIAGGSGITPIMSMIRTILAQETDSKITLIYGNRNLSSVIFRSALESLQAQYPQRLLVRLVLDKPARTWVGARGKLNHKNLTTVLDALGEINWSSHEVYLCGPLPMMQASQEVMLQRHVPAQAIHLERFTLAAESSVTGSDQIQPLKVSMADQEWQGEVVPGETLLDAGLRLGAAMPFSCTLGGCGRCRVKIMEGQVSMPEPNGLLPEEIAQGYTLACQAKPRTALHVVVDTPRS